MSPPAYVLDEGLQVERTTLAWRRTALDFLGVGALLVRYCWHTGRPVLGAVLGGLLVVTGCTMLLVTDHLHHQRVAHLRAAVPIAAAPAIRRVAVISSLASVAILVSLTVIG